VVVLVWGRRGGFACRWGFWGFTLFSFFGGLGLGKAAGLASQVMANY
jgi:hypothetical protein